MLLEDKGGGRRTRSMISAGKSGAGIVANIIVVLAGQQ